MKIDFNRIEPVCLPNFKGGQLHYETRRYVDDLNSIMQGLLIPGASIGMHTHTDSSETIFITEGTATVICDGLEETIPAGGCHYCPKGATHSMINRGQSPLRFFAVVPKQP